MGQLLPILMWEYSHNCWVVYVLKFVTAQVISAQGISAQVTYV